MTTRYLELGGLGDPAYKKEIEKKAFFWSTEDLVDNTIFVLGGHR